MFFRKKKYILLSYPLSKDTPLYGGTPPVRIEPAKRIAKGDSCNTFLISFLNHAGTHIDLPYHFDEGGKSLTDYAPEELIFHRPSLVRCPVSSDALVGIEDLHRHQSVMRSCDLLLLRTGFSLKRGSPEYYLHNPGIAAEAARWIRSDFSNIKAVGIDTISFSAANNREEGHATHRNFLCPDRKGNEPILLIEDIDLSKELSCLRRVFVIPLLIDRLDAAPCTVIAEID